MDWIFITNDPVKAAIAESAGVSRILVDLEILGKDRRQGHLDTAIFRHSLDDLNRVRAAVKPSNLMVRVNPIYKGSGYEVEQSVRAGASAIMLPMFREPQEVGRFIDHVAGRARVCLLLETPQAFVRADEILAIPGIDEVHIGLNDLHLGLGLTFMFEVVTHGIVDRLAEQLNERGIKFGFGGVARLREDQGPISPRLILSEHVRVGSTQVILSRDFQRAFTDAPDDSEAAFSRELALLRNCHAELLKATPEELQRNSDQLKNVVRQVVAERRASPPAIKLPAAPVEDQTAETPAHKYPRAMQWLVPYHRPVVLGVQLTMIAMANWLAFLLRFDGNVPPEQLEVLWQALPWLVAIRAATFVPFRLNQGLWKYTSLYDLQALFAGVVTSSVLFFVFIKSPLGPESYPRSVLIMDALLLLLMLGGLRLARRLYRDLWRTEGRKRVLIFGAGDAGELIVRDMKGDPARTYEPIGFVDDDKSKIGRRIHGVRVLGSRADMEKIIARHKPDEILIAVPTAEASTTRAIVRSLQPYQLPLKTLPNLRDVIDGRVEMGQIRGVSAEDLLARAPIGLDPAPVKRLIRGKRVLVTGAGGSIGSELCRQIAKLRPQSLVMLDRYENTLHNIVVEVVDGEGGDSAYAVVGDVTDSVRVDEVLAKYQPQIVFHAAAHKHVPLMEGNPGEAIKNNVRGTRVLAEAAERHGVDTFILISTDKAVRPTNVMGASKRVAELLVQQQQKGSGTSFSTVRFGNVIGSNGSVVPRFLEQIRQGGPVTVTHPEMRRFFMLAPEAVQLVLHAAAQAEAGAVYVLEMGEQIKLVDMARDLIRLSGFVPDDDIPIQFVGLRPGEKLYEELVSSDEQVGPSSIEKVFKVGAKAAPDEAWRRKEQELEEAAMAGKEALTSELLQSLVSDYVPFIDEAAEHERVAAEEPHSKTPDTHEPCPSCGEYRLHRSRARTGLERMRRNWSMKRLFRCEGCGWRGWLVPVERGVVLDPSLGTPIDLSSLDVASPPVRPAGDNVSSRQRS